MLHDSQLAEQLVEHSFPDIDVAFDEELSGFREDYCLFGSVHKIEDLGGLYQIERLTEILSDRVREFEDIRHSRLVNGLEKSDHFRDLHIGQDLQSAFFRGHPDTGS